MPVLSLGVVNIESMFKHQTCNKAFCPAIAQRTVFAGVWKKKKLMLSLCVVNIEKVNPIINRSAWALQRTVFVGVCAKTNEDKTRAQLVCGEYKKNESPVWHIYPFISIYLSLLIYLYTHISTHTYIYIHIYVYMYVYMYIHLHIYIHVQIYLHVYMYINIHIHINTYICQ